MNDIIQIIEKKQIIIDEKIIIMKFNVIIKTDIVVKNVYSVNLKFYYLKSAELVKKYNYNFKEIVNHLI